MERDFGHALEVEHAVFGIHAIALIARSVRKLVESKPVSGNQRNAGSAFDALRTPSDDFHDHIWLPLCQRVAGLAAERLGRALTPEERRGIWRSRSQLVLEVVKELATASPGEAAALLRNAPSGLDRPDPTGWCAL